MGVLASVQANFTDSYQHPSKQQAVWLSRSPRLCGGTSGFSSLLSELWQIPLCSVWFALGPSEKDEATSPTDPQGEDHMQ